MFEMSHNLTIMFLYNLKPSFIQRHRQPQTSPPTTSLLIVRLSNFLSFSLLFSLSSVARLSAQTISSGSIRTIKNNIYPHHATANTPRTMKIPHWKIDKFGSENGGKDRGSANEARVLGTGAYGGTVRLSPRQVSKYLPLSEPSNADNSNIC